jgi:hypothetical protein
LETSGDEVSATASGRLIMMETTKPISTVRSVASAWLATVPPMARLSVQMTEGAGTK